MADDPRAPGDRPVRPHPTSPTTVDTTGDDALGSSDAVDLLARLARREVSAAELREAALARARAANVPLNAVTRWIEQTPRTEVRVPDDAPLAGLPSLLKDNEELAGYPTSDGSRAVKDSPARACSPFVGQFLGLGADPVALTTLPEFGLTASTESSRFGATRNPWDTRRSAGGSSGGSAALVAAGVVPLAHANDGGGSIRIPASCCGLVGLKPSRGRLPDAVAAAKLPVPITVQGVLTRTVRDTALFYAAAERAHPAPALPSIGHVTQPAADRLRIGVCTTTVRDLPVSPEIAATVEAVGDLCSSLGHEVFDVGPPVDDQFASDFLALWSLMGLLLHRGGRYVYGPDFDPRVSPVTNTPPPPIGHLGPDVEFRTHLIRLMQFCSMTSVQNVSGAPAISLPLGRTIAGIPVGVQLAAPYGHERRLLELALELEEANPWPLTPGQQ